MVDYTLPQFRDETYRRWEGGDKLAADLRAFYTNKRVFDRLGQSVPLASPEAKGAKYGFNQRHYQSLQDRGHNGAALRYLRSASPDAASTPTGPSIRGSALGKGGNSK